MLTLVVPIRKVMPSPKRANSACVLCAVIFFAEGSAPLLAQTCNWIPSSIVVSETCGSVGIGTSTPSQLADIHNGQTVLTGAVTLATSGSGLLDAQATVTNNGASVASVRVRNTMNGSGNNPSGIDSVPTFSPSVSIGLARGGLFGAFFAPPGGVTISNAYGGQAITIYNNASGAVTTGATFDLAVPLASGTLVPATQYGLHVENQGIGGATNSYGVYVDSQSGSTNSYAAAFMGGNFGIGTATPIHRLQVAGTIGAEEIIVSSTGADYVFAPGYRLAPFNEVAAYIRDHHHLPDLPSAKEVQETGISVGDMQTKLLAKIEELTLHMIQAEERNSRLEQEVRELRQRAEKQ